MVRRIKVVLGVLTVLALLLLAVVPAIAAQSDGLGNGLQRVS